MQQHDLKKMKIDESDASIESNRPMTPQMQQSMSQFREPSFSESENEVHLSGDSTGFRLKINANNDNESYPSKDNSHGHTY